MTDADKRNEKVISLCIDVGAHNLGADVLCGNCRAILLLLEAVSREEREKQREADAKIAETLFDIRAYPTAIKIKAQAGEEIAAKIREGREMKHTFSCGHEGEFDGRLIATDPSMVFAVCPECWGKRINVLFVLRPYPLMQYMKNIKSCSFDEILAWVRVMLGR